MKGTHLGPLVARSNLAVLAQHLAKLAVGLLGRCALALAEIPQEALELLLAVALGLAIFAEARVLLVRALEIAEVRASRGDGRGEEGTVGSERLQNAMV